MEDPRPILVSGATGLIGSRLLDALRGDDIAVRALTRHEPAAGRDGVEWVRWDGRSAPESAVAGSRAVVHLAGEPLFGGLLTAARRERIHASRVESTEAFARTCQGLSASERPDAFVCASAVGYYGSRGDEILEESSAPGGGFLADVCVAWEAAAAGVESCGVRRVSARLGVVLSRQGGALALMLPPFRLGLGGRLGDGRQWLPWVHVDDAVALLRAAIDDPGLVGPLNAVSPEPVTNADFTRALGHRLGRPTVLAVPSFALRLVLGELANELLGSRRAVPRAALERGLGFRHPTIEKALAAELG